MSTLAKIRNEMKVEREFEGFAFPFTAGVMASIAIGSSSCMITPTYHMLALGTTVLSAILLLFSSRNRWNAPSQWTLIGICALTCGILTGLTGLELKISETASNGFLASKARLAGQAMEDLIDSISFKESSTGAIVKALLTGNRENIPPEIAQTFRDSGASHILALSGLHLGLIYMVISKILSLMGNSIRMRRIRSLLAIAICGFYTLMTGAGASITRALIFIILREAAIMTGRHASLKSILAASLFLHLAFSPTSITDIGFQLSYAAMFGIAYIFPHLRNFWKNDWPGLKFIWESAALSISCQITTGPLAYYYFGTFPQHFLLTNLLMIPLAGLLIPAALLTLALSAIGCCPSICVQSVEWMTQMMQEALGIIASM